ncbi:MAG: hypothetical protein D8M57_18995 [Candidatus Scalindua sp. AMX11]|nr:MAG: hypothetical protein D8M57_18995 [Candidatus Scalindua sp. AMX11]GJQ57402.1 MAG: hypothetical protein SCALA701_02030 [Candidatus Scalindua sp.]
MDGKTLDLDGKVEDTKFTERDTSITSRANIPLVNPEPTRTVITGKSSQYERSFDKQTNSKGNIASEADKLINNNPLIPKKKMVQNLSRPPVKSESHEGLSSEPGIKRVVPEQIKTSENRAMPEKTDLGIVHAYPKEKAGRRFPLKPEKLPSGDSLSFDKTLHRAIPEEIETSHNFMYSEHSSEQPLLIRNFQNAGKETQTLTPLVDNGSAPSGFSFQQGPTKSDLPDHFSIVKGHSSTPPTIKVTIGRIDVRAVMQDAPLPPRRTSTQKPKLSLDDYLKQRNGVK